jgi:alpha-L-fucosidase
MRTRLLVACCLLCTLTVGAWAHDPPFLTVPGGPHAGTRTTASVRAATDWLHDARFGVFMHFLPPNAKGLEGVRAFDVNALAAQLEAVGAKYLVITLGQNSGFFNAPNAAYDRITGYSAGERGATRDLPLALSDALRAKGIRLMLYLPSQPPNEDARAQRAFGLPEGKKDQPLTIDAARKWATVIQEWSDRYGDRASGWWFDGGYAWVRFNEEIAALYAAAAKHGNAASLVTFNPGVSLVRHTEAEDYTAGELNEPFDVVPASRSVGGSQWHALTFLGSHWGGRDTRYPTERWTSWVAQVVSKGGVVTIDAGPNWDAAAGPIGSLSEAQVAQLAAIGERARH